MIVVPFEQVRSAIWDRTYRESPQAWLFHSADWIALEERFFVGRNLSFALVQDGRMLALQPLYFSDAASGSGGECLLHSGIHRHTGLALASGTTREDSSMARAICMRQVLALAEQYDADRILFNVHNLTPESRSLERTEIPFWVERHGFHLGLHFGPQGFLPAPGMSTCNADQIVDLGPDAETLFADLDESCRRAVRKAIKAGLGFVVARDDAALDTYYDLACRSAQRTGESLAPLDYYREIWRRLHPSGRCALFFAYDGDRPAAALFLLIDKGAASYLAGVSDPELLGLRPNNFIHWSAMLWARERGLSEYRFGPIFPEAPPDWPIARVSRFKSLFGARSMTVIQGSFFRKPERYVEPAIAHLREMCRHAV